MGNSEISRYSQTRQLSVGIMTFFPVRAQENIDIIPKLPTEALNIVLRQILMYVVT